MGLGSFNFGGINLLQRRNVILQRLITGTQFTHQS